VNPYPKPNLPPLYPSNEVNDAEIDALSRRLSRQTSLEQIKARIDVHADRVIKALSARPRSAAPAKASRVRRK
jgi:hypothetical protein